MKVKNMAISLLLLVIVAVGYSYLRAHSNSNINQSKEIMATSIKIEKKVLGPINCTVSKTNPYDSLPMVCKAILQNPK